MGLVQNPWVARGRHLLSRSPLLFRSLSYFPFSMLSEEQCELDDDDNNQIEHCPRMSELVYQLTQFRMSDMTRTVIC